MISIKYYNYHSNVYGPFAGIFKNTKDYEELLKEQKYYLKYKDFVQYYKVTIKITIFSFSFCQDLSVYILDYKIMIGNGLII